LTKWSPVHQPITKKKVIGRLDITNGAESKTYTPQPNSGR